MRGVDGEADAVAGIHAGRPCVTSMICASPAWTSSSVSAPVGSTTMISPGTAPGAALASARCSGRTPYATAWPSVPALLPQRPAHAARGLDDTRAPSLRAQRAVDDVHRRRADELRDEQVVGTVVELERRADLLDAAVVHDDDAVGHGHRLDLVVRHVHGRRLQPLVQRLDLGAHRDAQLGVEVGQRLVEQEHLRVAHDGAAHRHALALAARQLARKALEVGLEVEDLRRVARRARRSPWRRPCAASG